MVIWNAGFNADLGSAIRLLMMPYINILKFILCLYHLNLSFCSSGPLVAEIHQVWTPWVSQVIRVYKEELTLEMEWLVGPIPIK